MCEIVKIYLYAHFFCQQEILIRSGIGAENNVISLCAYPLGQHKLCVGGAVKAASLLHKYFHYIRIGRSLNRKILPKALIP